MVDKVKLSAKTRDLTGKKVKQLRNNGEIPAVLYGTGRKPAVITLDAHDFALLYRTAGGNTIVEVTIEDAEGNKEKKNALIYKVDVDPVKGKILHADLLQIKMNEKITATIPLKFVGDSAAVIDLGGSLLTVRDEVEVECLPGDLPHEIEVNIGDLTDFDSVIHVSDLAVSENVAILGDLEETIAYVEAPRTDEELEEIEGEVASVELPESEHGGDEATEEKTEE